MSFKFIGKEEYSENWMALESPLLKSHLISSVLAPLAWLR